MVAQFAFEVSPFPDFKFDESRTANARFLVFIVRDCAAALHLGPPNGRRIWPISASARYCFS
ncbi:MAG: hypothetical protein QOK23_320 [Gammaproteobacteria bacterium]|jgi:hypothetical protein|nr:hypothetical protein [Gammaproteobacteria bacterium]